MPIHNKMKQPFLSERNRKIVEMYSKKMGVSQEKSLNILVERGFESSYIRDDSSKENIKKKQIKRKKSKKEKEKEIKRTNLAKLVSKIALIASLIGILIGVIYVLYIKQ